RYRAGGRMDHGLMVPLYFVAKAGADLPLLPVSMGLLTPERLYAFGVALQRAAGRVGRPVAVLASGDLSHRLLPGAPAGYHPDGEVFDREVVRLVEAMDVEGLLRMDPGLVDRAGECGWRSLLMMLGSLDGYRVRVEVLSYEGPFGVGYLTAAFTPLGEDPGCRRLERLGVRKGGEPRARAGEGYLVRLARETLECYVRGLPPPDPGEIPEEFRAPAGVFVSLKKGGFLRGCMGTVVPQKANVVEEVMANAITAGLYDPRFPPVRPEELDELEYSVDVLGPPEPVRGLEDLDPRRYGVIVRSGRRSGLLLPDLEGIDTPAQQVAIAREKAGIGPDEPVTLERFEVVRHK
ncbi:MAG: AmmeMemoRadiSam system protein A, partial [Firmicutes bacterium]|nr:AmmeMemoRadiSam system protein A [Bacillota bacterium]